jgi:hypothetical protein
MQEEKLKAEIQKEYDSGAILEEIDEELAALLDDDDLVLDKKKKKETPHQEEEEAKSEEVTLNLFAKNSGKNVTLNNNVKITNSKQSTNSLGHYSRLTRAVFSETLH